MSYQNIFDSHAHYNDERFDGILEETISSIQKNGVAAVLNAGCDLPSSYSGVELTKRYPFFYCSVGIHPHDAQNCRDGYLKELEALAKEEKVVAIGEIGLDYHYDFSPRDLQKKVFAEQLQLANFLDLPVIIHSREATADTMELLQKYHPHGVVHCFSGSSQTAKEILSLGMYLGFTGVVTFNNAKKVLEAVKATPADRLLLETDCPYMAPVPHRGKTCTSDMIAFTAEKIAQLKEMDTQALIDQAHQNTLSCFGINK
ncbi:Uncharacterized deoxyribonuclease YcfH [uncultured Ruminococcus sp.]|uniref:TatD family hydrolase n=1 Tax=Massiliimalia timonensis TaxID=1987501 RepID=UPI000821341E|nr:TatD family hydrolase [Massiliimalia timonensis]SCH27451.1 Uncharacterized deoxyribonuclease YcfH [uncultured Ruminococcus sp.]SCH31743.1 Uncharacterized deoxyribonuclease YcfH [uncultured Clostridium sp.]